MDEVAQGKFVDAPLMILYMPAAPLSAWPPDCWVVFQLWPAQVFSFPGVIRCLPWWTLPVARFGYWFAALLDPGVAADEGALEGRRFALRSWRRASCRAAS
jgi:hypothetical protein